MVRCMMAALSHNRRPGLAEGWIEMEYALKLLNLHDKALGKAVRQMVMCKGPTKETIDAGTSTPGAASQPVPMSATISAPGHFYMYVPNPR